jgi:hypothetical protein
MSARNRADLSACHVILLNDIAHRIDNAAAVRPDRDWRVLEGKRHRLNGAEA